MMRTLAKRIAPLCAVALSLCFASPSRAETAEPTFQLRLDKLVERLEERRVEQHIPGMALVVVKDDAVVLAHGFGVADIDTKRPVTPETLFAIGSSTKAFTATLVGMLVDEGKMNWDDPVTKFLPYLTLKPQTDDPKAEVTLRDLMSHRTGFIGMDILWIEGAVTREEALRTAAHAEPWSAFRKEFHYNNTGFLAAGTALGVAGGASWETLVAQRLFQPLGMTSTDASADAVRADPRVSLGYAWDADKKELTHLPMRDIDVAGPAGSINSNVLDMAQWLRFQIGHGVINGRRLISEAAQQETWKPNIDMGNNMKYGLGWMLQDWQGQPVVHHGGNIDGFSAMVAMLPEQHLGFVLLTNLNVAPLQNASINLVWDTLVGKWEDEAAVDTKQFEPFLGKYIANFVQFNNVEFTVSVTHGKLALDVPGQTNFELKPPDAEGKWHFALVDAIAVDFQRSDSGQVTGLSIYQNGQVFKLPKKGVEAAAAAPAPAVAAEKPKPAPPLPSVEQLLALRKSDSRRAALDALGIYRLAGTVRLAQSGVTGTIVMFGAGADRYRQDLDLGVFGHTRVAVNAAGGWMLNSFASNEALTGAALERARKGSLATIFGDWRLFYDKITVTQRLTVAGRAGYVVELRHGDSPPDTQFVDAQTGDVLRASSVTPVPGAGDIPVGMQFEDYRTVNGVRIPFRITTTNPVSGRVIFDIKSVEINLTAPADLFDLAPPK